MQILEWLSKNKSETVIVVITAYPHLGFRALELGVDALLYKPVEAQHVLNYTMRAIELRKLRFENKQLRETIALGASGNPVQVIEQVCSRFHTVVKQLRERHDGRPTLDVVDEYDVQDLLHALLRLFFDDIRAEEWTPTYAGGSARVDFLLKRQQVVIEVKKTRTSLGAKQVGDQLIIDIARYKAHPDCSVLYCFVYDPEGRITNPQGLESDLNLDDESFSVRVHIAPKSH